MRLLALTPAPAVVLALVLGHPLTQARQAGPIRPRAAASAPASNALFDDAAVQRVDLFVNSRDWERLIRDYDVNRYYPANFTWNGQTARNAAIRPRGLGSRSATKPGLRVDFEHYTSGQTFLGLKALVLDNLVQDASGLHEILSMKLFARQGLPAPRETPAALYLNNAFMGLYALVEEVDDVAVQRMFGESSSGYLYEYHWRYEYRFEWLGDDLAPYAVIFEPRTHEREAPATLYAPIASMIRTFNEAAALPDEDCVSRISELVDPVLFVRHAAVESYLAQWDGVLGYAGLNNFYLYRLPDARPAFRLIPWDQDTAFGAFWWPITAGHDENVLMRRLMAVAEWRARYFAEVDAAMRSAERSEVLDDGSRGATWLDGEILRLEEVVRATALADPRKPFTNDEVEAAWATLRAFVQGRGAQVRCQAARLNDPANVEAACAPLMEASRTRTGR